MSCTSGGGNYNNAANTSCSGGCWEALTGSQNHSSTATSKLDSPCTSDSGSASVCSYGSSSDPNSPYRGSTSCGDNCINGCALCSTLADKSNTNSGCGSCSSRCSSGCSSSCGRGCTGSCQSGCSGTCTDSCQNHCNKGCENETQINNKTSLQRIIESKNIKQLVTFLLYEAKNRERKNISGDDIDFIQGFEDSLNFINNNPTPTIIDNNIPEVFVDIFQNIFKLDLTLEKDNYQEAIADKPTALEWFDKALQLYEELIPVNDK